MKDAELDDKYDDTHNAVVPQKLPARERIPNREQQLAQQQTEAQVRAGETLGLPKGPIIDTAASKSAICQRDMKYATNVRTLSSPLHVYGSTGQDQVTQTADLEVGPVHMHDALSSHAKSTRHSVCS